MAFKAPITKEEKKLAATLQTMQALSRNEFKGDHVSSQAIEQARDFSKEYLPAMEDMLSSMQSLRKSYDSVERQFSEAVEKMPDAADKAIVYAGTGVAQVFATVISPVGFFTDAVADPKEVIVGMTKERQDFFRNMESAHKAVVGNPQGATAAAKKGTIKVFRETYAKAFFASNELVAATLDGNESLVKQKTAELNNTLKELKKASRNLSGSLNQLNAYTNSMEAIKTRVKKLTADMAIAIVGTVAAAKAIELGVKGISTIYTAASSAGKLATAGTELALETGIAGAETTYMSSVTLGVTAGARGIKTLEQGLQGAEHVEQAAVAARQVKRTTEVLKKATDVMSIEDASQAQLEASYNMAPPTF